MTMVVLFPQTSDCSKIMPADVLLFWNYSHKISHPLFSNLFWHHTLKPKEHFMRLVLAVSFITES